MLFVLMLIASPALALDPRDAVGVYVTWHADPTTSAGVHWVDLYENSGDTVWYRAAEETAWKQASGRHDTVADTVMRVHHVELTGLTPDTLYYFTLGEAETKNPKLAMKFRTMPATMGRPVRFVTGGDMMHSREMLDAMTRVAAKLDPDFMLLGGDLAYANDTEAVRWVDWLQSWTKNAVTTDGRLIPMIAVIGNHEVSHGGYSLKVEHARYYYDLFPTPGGASNFAVDFGDYLSILALDSHHSRPVPGQAGWLEAAMKERADQTYLFPVYHYPAYGTAKLDEGSTLPCDNAVARLIREHWVPKFERFGVTAVFENDHHTYKRTHRLRGHKRDDANGVLYLGDGAWGVGARPITPPVEQIWYLAKAEQRNHLWHVTLDGGKAKFQAVDVEGKVFDEATAEEPRTKPVEP